MIIKNRMKERKWKNSKIYIQNENKKEIFTAIYKD
jgi:hypothetical protein